jgi:hypothetical protein
MVVIVERWSPELFPNHKDNAVITVTPHHHFDVTTTEPNPSGWEEAGVVGFAFPSTDSHPSHRYNIQFVAGRGGSLSLIHEDCL